MGQYLILWVEDKRSAGLAGPEELLCEGKGKGDSGLGELHGALGTREMVSWEQRC